MTWDWFSEGSLRAQWRLAQVVLAVPLLGFSVTTIVWIGQLLFATDNALHWIAAMDAGDWVALLVTPALCFLGVEAIERHLAKPAIPQASPS